MDSPAFLATRRRAAVAGEREPPLNAGQAANAAPDAGQYGAAARLAAQAAAAEAPPATRQVAAAVERAGTRHRSRRQAIRPRKVGPESSQHGRF